MVYTYFNDSSPDYYHYRDMEDREMDKIILLNAGKTKTGKTVINYAYNDPKDKFKKGFNLLTQFLDIPNFYDSLGVNDFGKTYDAEFVYVDTYNGQARKEISRLVTENGELVFEV